MTSEERQVVLDLLDSGEGRLLELTAGLSAAQWSFQETPERWSIAGNISTSLCSRILFWAWFRIYCSRLRSR